jgi:hypothetical protein
MALEEKITSPYEEYHTAVSELSSAYFESGEIARNQLKWKFASNILLTLPTSYIGAKVLLYFTGMGEEIQGPLLEIDGLERVALTAVGFGLLTKLTQLAHNHFSFKPATERYTSALNKVINHPLNITS